MIMNRQVLFLYLQTWETQSKPNQENEKKMKSTLKIHEMEFL